MESLKRLVDKTLGALGYIPTLTAKSWSALFSRGQEQLLFGESIRQPFAQIPSVYKAVKAICDNVPQAEIIFRNMSDQEEQEGTASVKALENLFRKPNPQQSQNDFIKDVAGFYALHGEVMIEKIQSVGQATGSSKVPAGLRAWSPDLMKKVKDGNGHITGFEVNGKSFPLDVIIHIKDFNPYDTASGMSPTTPIEKLLEIDHLSTVFNKAFFENNACPPFALTTDKTLSDDQRDRLKTSWNLNNKGAKNQFKINVLEGGLKATSFGSSQKDMDFLEQKKFTREEILGNWRTPKALFNITEDLNYATFVGQMKVFWLYGLMPMLRTIEDGLNRHLVMAIDPTIYLEFDIRTVPAFQEDFSAKITSAKDLFGMGVPLNAINEKLDLGFDAFPWGDDWWVGVGLIPASMQAEAGYVDPNAEPAPSDKPVEDPEETPDPETAKAKNAPMTADPVLLRASKSFITKHSNIETRFAGSVRSYFYHQRQKVLKNFMENFSAQNPEKKDTLPHSLAGGEYIQINWANEQAELKKRVTPYLKAGIEAGVASGQDSFPADHIDTSKISEKVLGVITDRARRVAGFSTATIAKQLSATIQQGIKDGSTMQEIADAIRDTYNVASSRAMLIARTETTGAMNAGSMLYYKEAGVNEVMWATAGDEAVRETHRAQNGVKRILGEPFPNGLRFPSDNGEPSEVCNCRCTLIPVV